MKKKSTQKNDEKYEVPRNMTRKNLIKEKIKMHQLLINVKCLKLIKKNEQKMMINKKRNITKKKVEQKFIQF